MKRVHEERTRNFICDICNQNFYTKADLKTHKVKVHNKGGKKFKCGYCTKTFWDEKKTRKRRRTSMQNVRKYSKLASYYTAKPANRAIVD